jgi:hypothetical protein
MENVRQLSLLDIAYLVSSISSPFFFSNFFQKAELPLDAPHQCAFMIKIAKYFLTLPDNNISELDIKASNQVLCFIREILGKDCLVWAKNCLSLFPEKISSIRLLNETLDTFHDLLQSPIEGASDIQKEVCSHYFRLMKWLIEKGPIWTEEEYQVFSKLSKSKFTYKNETIH